jgi:hypothetical protein
MTVRKGRCLCGEVTYEYRGPENWRGHCHCESCRRNTSSPFTTWFGVPRAACRFTGKQPAVYRSSPGVRRLFCANCGTPMAYDSDRYPDEIHILRCKPGGAGGFRAAIPCALRRSPALDRTCRRFAALSS